MNCTKPIALNYLQQTKGVIKDYITLSLINYFDEFAQMSYKQGVDFYDCNIT